MRLAILPKFLKAKNSLLGPNNQQKSYSKNTETLAQKSRKKSVKNVFAVLA